MEPRRKPEDDMFLNSGETAEGTSVYCHERFEG